MPEVEESGKDSVKSGVSDQDMCQGASIPICTSRIGCGAPLES